jgi:hypothetical protein
MSYGNHAEVLAPESLRAEVAAEVAAMVQRYGDKIPLHYEGTSDTCATLGRRTHNSLAEPLPALKQRFRAFPQK